ncbi:hypothetical protein [Streptomyces sp. NPDC050704]
MTLPSKRFQSPPPHITRADTPLDVLLQQIADNQPDTTTDLPSEETP